MTQMLGSGYTIVQQKKAPEGYNKQTNKLTNTLTNISHIIVRYEDH